MSTFILLAPLLLQLLGQLPGLIQTAETAFGHKAGAGAAKKALVVDTLDASLKAAAMLGVKEVADGKTQDAIKAVAGGLTDSIVAGLNAAGVLKQDAPQG